MESFSDKKKSQRYGCLAIFSGCLVFALLFPFCTWLFGWLSFAFFASIPSTFLNGLLGFTCFLGGIFGIPIAAGVGVSRIVQGLSNRWRLRQRRERQ